MLQNIQYSELAPTARSLQLIHSHVTMYPPLSPSLTAVSARQLLKQHDGASEDPLMTAMSALPVVHQQNIALAYRDMMDRLKEKLK